MRLFPTKIKRIEKAEGKTAGKCNACAGIGIAVDGESDVSEKEMVLRHVRVPARDQLIFRIVYYWRARERWTPSDQFLFGIDLD